MSKINEESSGDAVYREIEFNEVQLQVYYDGRIFKPTQRIGKQYMTGKWLVNSGSHSKGYSIVYCGNKSAKWHRIVARAWLPNYSDNLEVDHINGVKTDNYVGNLRMVTHHQNCKGFQSRRKTNSTSKYRGVYKYKGQQLWSATCRIGSKNYFKRFDDEIEAAKAYDKVALENGYSIEATNSYIFGI